MALSWYSITISATSNSTIFDGYFSVDASNLVTAFYDKSLPLNGFYQDVLLSTNDIEAGYNADNVYPFTFERGLNFYSQNLKDFFDITQNHFNIYQVYQGDQLLLYTFLTNTLTAPLYTIATPTSIPDPSCFNEGTKILCLNTNFQEEYIPIENLRKGDLVKSYKHGYRKIELIGKNPMINNPEKFNACMYKMEKTEDNGLLEDLIVTGGHSILVDNLGEYKEENDKIFGGIQMIDDKYLLLSAVSKDFKKLEHTHLYTYYHFILENNGNDTERFGVWANGVLTETTCKQDFMNHTYTVL